MTLINMNKQMYNRKRVEDKYIVNERIRAENVRLILDDGEQKGVVSIQDARKIASERNLDLLLISDKSNPPVCKLVNIGQYKYQQQKKDKQSKKAKRSQIVKELKMSPKISSHDFGIRIQKGRRFLENGYKVKVSISFRGREITHMNIGEKLIQKYITEVEDIGAVDGEVMRSGRSLIAMLHAK